MKRKGATKSQRALYAVLRRIEMEDKQAIKEIDIVAQTIEKFYEGTLLLDTLKLSGQILESLTSLGYVKLADEQKLPECQACEIIGDTEYNQRIKFYRDGYLKAQHDMLSVDSEGCTYRRVRIK
jgi:hypothetical protein